MTTTDTPRTDAVIQSPNSYFMVRVESLCRELERDLNASKAEVERLREAIVTAYTHNQNMHCYQTKGRLNDELNNQTMVLRKALKPTNK